MRKTGILTAMLAACVLGMVTFVPNFAGAYSLQEGIDAGSSLSAERVELFPEPNPSHTIINIILFILGVSIIIARIVIVIKAFINIFSIKPELKEENGRIVEVWTQEKLEKRSFWNGAFGLLIGGIMQVYFHNKTKNDSYWKNWFKGFIFLYILPGIAIHATIFFYAIANFLIGSSL